jgi:electron transport complex protein RnfC
MIAGLFRFNGGVKPDTHKDESATFPIRKAPLPSRLLVPLRQSARTTARCIVTPGQKVLKGERIGEPDDGLSTAVHAPTSGTVVDVELHTMAHASGLGTRCVVIVPDGEDRWVEPRSFDAASASRAEKLAWLRDCGVVGLGGATFPSHIKAGKGSGIDTLVLNGAECEPWITCDDRLMRERAESILAGAMILRDLVGASRILVGVEDNKPEAIRVLEQAAPQMDACIRIVPIPAIYPAGGEKQLIRVLTGIEIPHGKLGGDFGVQCFNVGTAHAVHRAFAYGEPLISRVVTLTGNVANPGNLEALIGTPVRELLALAQPHADTDRVLLGGPMMGFEMPSDDVPLAKGSNCIIACSPKLFPPPPPEMNCIRCGACAQACPAELQPFELYWFSRARNFGKAQEYHLFDCIECGCCAYVCPSHIRLVDYYRFAKSEIWARERDKSAADAARERFEFRNERQEREKREKAERLAAKAAATKAKLAQSAPADSAEDAPKAGADDPDAAKRALIAAALERAKQQKAQVEARNTDNLTPAQAAQVAQADDRRRPGGAAAPAEPAGDTPAAAPEEH